MRKIINSFNIIVCKVSKSKYLIKKIDKLELGKSKEIVYIMIYRYQEIKECSNLNIHKEINFFSALIEPSQKVSLGYQLHLDSEPLQLSLSYLTKEDFTTLEKMFDHYFISYKDSILKEKREDYYWCEMRIKIID